MNTKDMIRNFLANNFLLTSDGSKLDDDASLLEEGVVDSTGILDVILFVEQTFGFSVNDEDVVPDNFDSVNKITAYVDRTKEAA